MLPVNMWHSKPENVIFPGDMWHEKQENVTLSSQTCPPQSFQGYHMEILRPPSGTLDVDFFGVTSKNHQSTAMNQPGAMAESSFPYRFPSESNLQKAGLLSGAQVEQNTHGLFSDRTKFAEPTTFRHQYEKDNQSCYASSRLTSNRNFDRNETKNTSNASSCLPSQPLAHKGSFNSLNLQAPEYVLVSNCQRWAHNMVHPSDSYASLPAIKSFVAHTGKTHVASHFEEVMSIRIENQITDKSPPGMFNTPSKGLSREILQQSVVKPTEHSVDIDGRIFSQEDGKPGSSHELKQSSHFNKGINVPTAGATSIGSSVCTELNRDNRISQNEVQFGSSEFLGVNLGKISGSKERQSQGDGSVRSMDKTEAPDMKSVNNTLLENSSPKYASPSNTVDNYQQNDLTSGSLRSDEKSKSHFGKPAPVVAEKLWDGSLQLSSSVTLSAVAFFKSGEKLLDANWCESVEVKGKVRLEAFEKYVQDLPRSRNRGLMVISLCWKEGTSETGLTGMKEVAKGYKNGEKIGFAHLSPGIDLYICPRTDAIITILAKYGFFKGVAAVEDKPDSMIGCVVWRKNRTSSSSVVKKPEGKSGSVSEKPVASPSNPSMQQARDSQPAQASNSPASVAASSTTEDGKSGSGIGIIHSSTLEIANCNSSSGPNSLPTSSVPSGSISSPAGLQGQEEQPPIAPFPSDILKETVPSSEDDDLPEFDFTAACGISQTYMSKPSDTVLLNKRLPAEGIRSTDCSVLSVTPNVQAMPVSSQRSDHSVLPGLPRIANEGTPPLKKVCKRKPPFPVFPMEERPSIENKVAASLVRATIFAPPKNIFDDDDDMPEWCPPEFQSQSLAGTRPSTSTPEFRNSTYQTSARGPPLLALPSPSKPSTRPPFSSQGFPPAFHRPTTKAASYHPAPKASQPRGSSSSMGFNSHSILGPPPSFDAERPFRPANKRG